jgi:hypothetical protein
MQTTQYLLMIEPVSFGFNAATAVNNSFQKDTSGDIQQSALAEFNAFVDLLRQNKIDVTVVKDTADPHTPDSIFPNNWISFHEDGTVFLYPMFAMNRRKERKDSVLDAIRKKFIIQNIQDLSVHEQKDIFLEGTGSMVLDRVNRIAYACLSPRTSPLLLNEFCGMNNYTPVIFRATDEAGNDIYHTNVMMCVAGEYAVVCLGSIADNKERDALLALLRHTNKEVIEISPGQLNCFAGNMLQVRNADEERILLMSSQAHASLFTEQVNELEKFNRIVYSPLDNIEMAGGGSARCMMAEVFLETCQI